MAGGQNDLYVTGQDIQKEIFVIKKVAGEIVDLFGSFVRRNIEKTSVFDFYAHRDNERIACLDVKVRDIDVNAFDTLFISADKIEHKKNCKLLHFVIFYFPKNKLVRIFDLAYCSLVAKTQTIFHKRAKMNKTQTIFLIKQKQMLHELSI